MKICIVSLLALCTFGLDGQPLRLAPPQSSWEAVAKRVPGFDDQLVTALASAGDKLYVAAARRLLVYSIANGTIEDATSLIRADARDAITSILVDAARKELWIGTNGNGHAATCYDYALKPGCASKAYLDEWLRFADNLSESKTPELNSIWTFDRDGTRAVVGFFKGSIYAYEVSSGRYRLAYRPTDIYNAAIASLVRGNCALVGTRGDGLIAIDFDKSRVTRYPDSTFNNNIWSLATDGREVFLGAKGLHRAALADFCGAS